jgi:Tfp pilus tip-associated adhesin PilY1
MMVFIIILFINKCSYASGASSCVSSGASVSVNGEELNSGTVLYQASYSSDSWTGELTAYPVDPDTGEIKKKSSDILWKASDKLQGVKPDNRRIFTYDPVNGTGIKFRFGSITNDQASELNSDVENKIKFIRGEEISGFRSRSRKLGDIIHSAPLLAGDTIFVGGNDGMLHAVNASTGEERFAYIPDLVISNFYNSDNPEQSFTEPGYTHKFFVDGSTVVRTKVGANSKTFLVGGLGKGGKGYYCLDITDADNIDDTKTEDDIKAMVKWEFPLTSDADMGYSFSTPAIVKTNSTDHEWVVIFGNGYGSANSSAVLYILDIDGNLLKKIDTASSGSNGLSTPSVIDVNNDYKADYVYAGDLQGNMWKFDLSSSDLNKWEVAYMDDSKKPMPLFQAPGQPITMQADVTCHCEKEGYMVIFGTGRFLDESDRTSTDIQSVFGIWDFGDDKDNSEYLGRFNRGGSPQLSNMLSTVTLLEQTEIDNRTVHGNYLRTLSKNDADGWPTIKDSDNNQNPDPKLYAGWFFDLPIKGERIIKDAMIRYRNVVYISFTPDSSPCPDGGDSIIHEADVCTGAMLDTTQIDVNNDKLINDDDLIDIGLTDENGNPVLVAPTGIKRPGLLHYSPVLRLNKNREIKFFSSSTGTTVTLFEKAEKRGLSYWIDAAKIDVDRYIKKDTLKIKAFKQAFKKNMLHNAPNAIEGLISAIIQEKISNASESGKDVAKIVKTISRDIINIAIKIAVETNRNVVQDVTKRLSSGIADGAVRGAVDNQQQYVGKIVSAAANGCADGALRSAVNNHLNVSETVKSAAYGFTSGALKAAADKELKATLVAEIKNAALTGLIKGAQTAAQATQHDKNIAEKAVREGFSQGETEPIISLCTCKRISTVEEGFLEKQEDIFKEDIFEEEEEEKSDPSPTTRHHKSQNFTTCAGR